MGRIFSFLFKRSTLPNLVVIVLTSLGVFAAPAIGTTKGLSQIVTPELQNPGDLSLSFQAQSERIANTYAVCAGLGLENWAEFAVFRGFKPDEWIFSTEFGLL